MFMFFDTETSGFISNSHPFAHPRQGRIMSVAALLLDAELNEASHFSVYIDIPEHVEVNQGAFEAHGLTKEFVKSVGVPIEAAIILLDAYRAKSKYQIAHNFKFDLSFIHHEESSIFGQPRFLAPNPICTMEVCTPITQLPFASKRTFGKEFKWPKLGECVKHFFNEKLEGAHDALADVRATARVFKYLWSEGYLDKYKNSQEQEK